MIPPKQITRYGMCFACGAGYLWRVVQGEPSYRNKTHQRAGCPCEPRLPLKAIRSTTYVKLTDRRGEPPFVPAGGSRRATDEGCQS
jgi:hypothetical protein